jgi:predicted transcriptional regulator
MPEIKDKIKHVLEKHPEGLTIVEISGLINSHRHTASKYLLVLEAEGNIVARRLGPVSLWYLKKHYNPQRRSSK